MRMFVLILILSAMVCICPRPSQAKDYAVIMKPSAPLRYTQGLSGRVIGVLRQGDQVEILGRTDGWSRVYSPLLGERGFVNEIHLRESHERLKYLRKPLELLECPEKGCHTIFHLPKHAPFEILEYTYPGGRAKWARIWAYDAGIEGWVQADKVIY